MHVPRLSNKKATIEAVKREAGVIFMGFEEKIKGLMELAYKQQIQLYLERHAKTHTLKQIQVALVRLVKGVFDCNFQDLVYMLVSNLSVN